LGWTPRPRRSCGQLTWDEMPKGRNRKSRETENETIANTIMVNFVGICSANQEKTKEATAPRAFPPESERLTAVAPNPEFRRNLGWRDDN
jgi:hypothetical protein